MENFTRVVYNDTQAEIAKVNRVNGTLYINRKIWAGLPAGQKEFVLLHEGAHLNLQTTSEFEANRAAVERFAPVRTLTNSQLGARIVVMRNILTPQKEESGFLAEGIAGAVNGIFSVLPVLGIGSKARAAEATANAAAGAQLITAQSKAEQKASNSKTVMIVLSGVFLVVIVTLFLILRK